MIYEIIKVQAKVYNAGDIIKSEDELIGLFEHDDKGIVLIDGKLVSGDFLLLDPQEYFDWIKGRFDLIHSNIVGQPKVDYIDAGTGLICKSDVMHLIFEPIYSDSMMASDFIMNDWDDTEAYGYDAEELHKIARLRIRSLMNPNIDRVQFLVLYSIYASRGFDGDTDFEPSFAGEVSLPWIAKKYEEFKDLNKAFGGFGDTLSDAVAKANRKADESA